MRWYISVEAVRQYMRIMGYAGSMDGPVFDSAAIELETLCEQAKLAKDVGRGQHSQLWRVKTTVKDKRTRLELVVSLSERPEGELPQLIAVRNKGA